MQNFVLENTTKIIFGRDTIKQIGEETKVLGNKILLVYGQNSIKNNGIYDQVTTSLADQSIDIVEHGGVQSNPILSHVQKGIKIGQKEKVDAIVAVGGGSVIDSAKAIAAGIPVKHDVWKFFLGKKGVTEPLPVLSVLTLAASGSEMNGGMVLTNEKSNLKLGIGNKKLCPKVSILDPSATYTVPADYTAFGVVDAMAHTLEFYCTCEDPSTPVQDRFMEGLLVNLIESGSAVCKTPLNYDIRANIMWSATLALNGWTSSGLGKVGFPMHLIEHSLSAMYNVPHGAGLSVIVPAWMTHQVEKNPDKIAQFSERVFGVSAISTLEKARTGIQLLKEWFCTIKSPTTLQELAIPSSDISKIAENSQGLAKLWRLQSYSQTKVEEILNLC